MSTITRDQILAHTRELVAAKTASAKSAAPSTETANAGPDPSTMPGAEHDGKLPEEFKQPDSETRDETMVPNSGLKVDGAGDDSALTRGHAVEADESVLSPTKKPAVTADANAKTASGAADLANEILGLIHAKQKQASEKPAEKVAAKPAETPAEKVAEKPAVPTPAPETTTPQKEASEPDMVLTTDVMAKLAAMLLSTDEGAETVEKLLQKQAGAEFANETLGFLADQSELAQKQAAYQAGEADAQALIEQQIYEAGLHDGWNKAASEQMYKLGQEAADASIADLMGGMPPEAMGAEGLPPEAMGAEGPPPEAMGDEGLGDITEEDIVGALTELVESGELPPEDAEAVLQEILGEGAGAEPEVAPEGVPEAVAEELPPEMAGAPTDMPPEKLAAADLLDAIRKIRAGNGK